MTYGERLRELRAERRLSLRQVEERGGPNKDTMSLIERGVHKPHAQTLGRIAQAFDMDIRDLRAELEGAEYPLGEAGQPPEPDYGTLLKERGVPSEQIAAWLAQNERDEEFIRRELEKMSPKDVLEALIASPGARRLRDYYRQTNTEATTPPQSESA